MSNEFRTLLQNYLDGNAAEDDIRYWVSFNMDDPPDDIVPLIYDVALALWDMEYARERGYATEDHFRAAVADLLAEELELASSGDA